MTNNATPLPPAGTRPFTTPEGFIASLPDEIIRRNATLPTKSGRKERWSKILRIGIPAAAAAAIAIMIGNLPAGSPQTTITSEQAFAALSAEDQTDLLDYYTDNIFYDDETYN